MAVLTRDQILGADDLPTEEVQVPEWGGSVFIRSMTGTQRDKFEAQFIKARDSGAPLVLRSKLAVLTVCNEKGELVFTEPDMIELGKKSAKALDRVFGASTRLSGIGEDDVKELEGNSDGAPSADSGSS